VSDERTIIPDTRDWAEVLEQGCPDCGFTGDEPVVDAADAIRGYAGRWTAVLRRPDASVRPDPGTWSPLEYGAHVRDVCGLFRFRTRLMRENDDPQLPSWSGDDVAIEKDYLLDEPDEVLPELLSAAESYASELDTVVDGDWVRPGHRDDGRQFTIASLTRYGLHEMRHHLHDVAG
jgi:hypothetical protein